MRRRVRRLVAGAAVLVVAVLSHPWWLSAVGGFLIVEDPLRPADAIVVLGGDWKGRIDTAVELYRRGIAPRILVSGGRLVAPDTTEADLLAALARRAGVPASAIVRERTSTSTWENARHTLPVARRLGVRRVILVTSDWHSRRARWVFRRVYGPAGIEVLSRPSPEWRFPTRQWWRYPEGGETVLVEYLRLGWYWAHGLARALLPVHGLWYITGELFSMRVAAAS